LIRRTNQAKMDQGDPVSLRHSLERNLNPASSI